MEKKQMEIGITVMLVIIFIIALANSVKSISKKNKAKAPVVVVQGALVPKKNIAPAKSVSALSGQYAEDLEWGRDPFSGKTYSAEKKGSALHLIGIIWDAKNPLAMINERILKTGDVIQGKQIIRINSDSVIIDDGSKEIELKLQQ